MYEHDPRHVGVLLKGLGLEQVNSVQTPATHDVTDEEVEPFNSSSTQQLQVARCKMFCSSIKV